MLANAAMSPIPLIDSHAHLDFDRFDADRDAVLTRAASVGVERVITIGTTVDSSRRAFELTQQYAQIYSAAGIHPHSASEFDDADWPLLQTLWAEPKVRAVGETGLDYFYDHSTPERQRALFRRHLEVAGEVGLPVVVHIRDAFDDAFAAVADIGLPAGGIVHCFTGGPAECERALALGFHISLSGIVSFKSAKALRSAVPMIPIERLLVETDSPFLAPVPHRGKRNEPAFVVDVARVVAELRQMPLAELAAATVQNTVEIFGLPALG